MKPLARGERAKPAKAEILFGSITPSRQGANCY